MFFYRRLILLFFLPLILAAQTPQQCQVELFIGDPEFYAGDDGPALSAKLSGPSGVAVHDGFVYVSDRFNNRIRAIDPQGTISTVAGTGTAGTSGDGGSALQAELSNPGELSAAPDGTLYAIDDLGGRLRRILPGGLIEMVYRAPTFGGPAEVAAGPDGAIYFVGEGASIFRLQGAGPPQRVAGGGDQQADNVPALDFRFVLIRDLLVSQNGDLLVADYSKVMSIGQDGMIRTVVGGGQGAFQDGSAPLDASLSSPEHLAEDSTGALYIGDRGRGLLRLRNGAVNLLSSIRPQGLAGETDGVVFSAEDGRVYRLNPDSSVEAIAGVDRSATYEPGRPLNQTHVDYPQRMLTDSQGRLYYFNFLRDIIYRTTLDGKLEIFAGGGDAAIENGVSAKDVLLGPVNDIAIDGQDRLYVSADSFYATTGAEVVLRVEPDETITVLAGRGDTPFYRPNVAAIDIHFNGRSPLLAVTPDGVLYFNWDFHVVEVGLDGIARLAFFDAFKHIEPGFLSADELGKVFLVRSDALFVFADASPNFERPYIGRTRQVAGAADGNLFVLGGLGKVFRVAPDGRQTDFFPIRVGFEFREGLLGTNSSLPSSIAAIAVNKDQDLFLADSVLDRVFVMRNAGECLLERPSVAALVNGASFGAAGVSPGELVSAFGYSLGPEQLAYGAPGQSDSGTWQTKVGGLEVLVDGKPAPVIFSRSDQAAFVVPNDASGLASIRFRLNGVASDAIYRTVRNASPGLFTANSSGGGQAAALNQDNSINGPANPAAAGSVIVLYLTGAGVTNPPSVTGSLNDFPLPQLGETVEVLINNVDAIVEFAGPAPGLVSGVVQVNARIPTDTPSGPVPVKVKIGGVSSPLSPSDEPVTISIQ